MELSIRIAATHVSGSERRCTRRKLQRSGEWSDGLRQCRRPVQRVDPTCKSLSLTAVCRYNLTVASLARLPRCCRFLLPKCSSQKPTAPRTGARSDIHDLLQCFVVSWTLFSLSVLHTNRVWTREWNPVPIQKVTWLRGGIVLRCKSRRCIGTT